MDNHEDRIAAELIQLVKDITRLGTVNPETGKASVLFGTLFDCDQVQNYYEALVGTLKAGKKRGLISFEGQMLLKGAHDKVEVKLL